MRRAPPPLAAPIAVALAAVALATLGPAAPGRAAPDDPAALAWGEARPLCTLAEPEVHESSGVACSRRLEGVFWTHNDSGDRARLFAFDRAGATRTLEVEGAENDDWEDIASFERGGKGWLLVADTGDNKSERATVDLYLVEEPRALPPPEVPHASLPLARRVVVRYEDGAHDCEGVGVDVVAGQVLLVTKVRRGDVRPTVYALPLEACVGPRAPAAPVVATKVAALDPAVPLLTTGLDVSPDGRRLVVCTYGDAYAWARGEGEPWAEALRRPPARVALPRRDQGEALCFGRDGRTLVITSEGRPCPVWELPPAP